MLSPVRKALTLIVQHPGLARVAASPDRLRGVDLPGAALLAELIELLVDNPHLNTGALVERYRDHEGGGRHLASLAAEPLDLETETSNLEGRLEQEFRDCLHRIAERDRERSEDRRRRELEAKEFSQLDEEEREEYVRLTVKTRK